MIDINNLNLDTAILLAGIAVLLIAMIFWHFNRDKKFDMASVMTNPDGTFSLMKFGQLSSLLTSTWVVIYQTRHSVLTEAVLSLYILTWAGSNALSKYLDSKKSEDTK